MGRGEAILDLGQACPGITTTQKPGEREDAQPLLSSQITGLGE